MRGFAFLVAYILALCVAYQTHHATSGLIASGYVFLRGLAPFPHAPEITDAKFLPVVIWGMLRFIVLQLLIYGTLAVFVLWKTYVLEIALAHRVARLTTGHLSGQRSSAASGKLWVFFRGAAEAVLALLASPFVRPPSVSAFTGRGGRLMASTEDPNKLPLPTDKSLEAAKNPLVAHLQRLALVRHQRLTREQTESVRLCKEGTRELKEGTKELIELRRSEEELARLPERQQRQRELDERAHQLAVLEKELEILRLEAAKRRVEEGDEPRGTSAQAKMASEIVEKYLSERSIEDLKERHKDDPLMLDVIDRVAAKWRQEEF